MSVINHNRIALQLSVRKMAYVFYSVSFFLLVLVTGMSTSSYVVQSSTLTLLTVLYFTRARWLPIIQSSFPQFYQRIPSSFLEDAEAGLHSSNFDLSLNIANDDEGRSGLDNEQKREVLKIMRSRRVNFDEARRIYMERTLEAGGVGKDGLPRDPKFVSFS